MPDESRPQDQNLEGEQEEKNTASPEEKQDQEKNEPAEPEPAKAGDEPADGDQPEGGEAKAKQPQDPGEDEPKQPEQKQPEPAGDQGQDQVPPRPEDYRFEIPPEVAPADDPVLKSFRQVAHQKGLTQEQAKAVIDFYANFRSDELAARGRLVEQGMELLKQDWGDDYDRNLALANKALERFGGAELVEELRVSPLGTSPALARAFLRVGRAISEDRFVDGQRGKPNQQAAKEDQELYGEL